MSSESLFSKSTLQILLLTAIAVVLFSCVNQTKDLKNKENLMESNQQNYPLAYQQKNHIGITQMDFIVDSGKKIHAYIWYPADISNSAPSSFEKDYLTSNVMQKQMSRQFGMPKFSISTKETTHALVDAAIIEQGNSALKLPVVFFSHGFASFARQNNRMMEYYAKQGFIVIALSNPGESLVTEYTDGNYIEIDQNTKAMQKLQNMNKSELKKVSLEISTDFNSIKNANNDLDYLNALKALGNNSLFSLYAPYVQSGSKNLTQSIAYLKTHSSPVVDKIDFSKIVLIGHSLGGLISIDANRELKRISQPAKVVISLDSPAVIFNFQDVTLDNFNASAHCAYQGGFTKLAKQDIGITKMNEYHIQKSPSGGCTIDSQKAHHNNYTDMSYIGFLKWIGLTGKVNGKKFAEQINESSVAIMQHYLYNDANQKLDTTDVNQSYSNIEVFHAR